ncbi:hypothetical protein [Aliiglaciecola sp. LCG003]|uniref:hypothetical protein n=1 Tax=Aliiglaciecola sp. LCG003 TaxID=3053655 RepID=UPI002572DC57|nr:hypothetical protein [Aliiglaciecola sp. LCG003]WJG08309.1 hypothetical protein QR722_13285 [Aliiglaciecola sp. LCG003]
MIISRMLCFVSLCFSSFAVQAQETDNLSSLHRFNPDATLPVISSMNIRQVYAGNNVLAKSIALAQSGGKLQYISGGNRSSEVKIEFQQPYKESELIESLELHFDKKYGFINQVTLTYKIASRYLDILPVYDKTLQQAVSKYGEPLSFKTVQDIVKTSSSKPKFADFRANLTVKPELKDEIAQYLNYKQVTSKTHFIESENGRALLLTGFKQCYFWPKQEFAEILTLCAFQPSSGNMKGQGVTLSLVDFRVKQAIEHYQSEEAEININL